MRVVAGAFAGRTLASPNDFRVRPTAEPVRAALLDLLAADLPGASVLDLFAGTGALGFEAVSRGAAGAIFAERHFPTADALRRTAVDLGVADRCEIRPGDVLLWARRMPDLPTASPWLVFISPPWAMFAPDHDRRGDLLALIAAVQGAAPAGSTLVVESDTGFDPTTLPDPDGWHSRAIPPAVLHISRPAADDTPNPPGSGIFSG